MPSMLVYGESPPCLLSCLPFYQPIWLPHLCSVGLCCNTPCGTEPICIIQLLRSLSSLGESYCLIYVVDRVSSLQRLWHVPVPGGCWASPDLSPPFLAGCLSQLCSPRELQELQGGRETLGWEGERVFSWGGTLVAWPVLGLMG